MSASSKRSVKVLDVTGRVISVRTGVPTAEVLAAVLELVRAHGLRVVIDSEPDEAKATSTRERPVVDSRVDGSPVFSGAWKFLLTDDQLLCRVPLVDDGAGDPTLRGGPAAGGLVWQPIEEHGTRGLAATWRRGTFKILRLGSGHCALFYERRTGDWEALALGAPDALKEQAGVRASAPRPPTLSDDLLAAVEAAAAVERRRS